MLSDQFFLKDSIQLLDDLQLVIINAPINVMPAGGEAGHVVGI